MNYFDTNFGSPGLFTLWDLDILMDGQIDGQKHGYRNRQRDGHRDGQRDGFDLIEMDRLADR